MYPKYIMYANINRSTVWTNNNYDGTAKYKKYENQKNYEAGASSVAGMTWFANVWKWCQSWQNFAKTGIPIIVIQ